MVATTSSSSTTSTTTINQNGVESSNGAVPKNNNDQVTFKTLPKGKYTLVGIDIDTTGRRLIDEIVQLAAFTPNDHFEQYIMPYMNLNPAARQRHQVRVISIGFYRMLKSTQTYKIIKSKSEIAALKDFLHWIEALKAKDTGSQGIILVYHEERKFIPYMVLESLKKYNLLDRFLNTVKSFANGLNLAKANADEALQHYTLRKLSKHLKDNFNNVNVEENNNSVFASSTTTASEAGETASALPEQQLSEKKKSPKPSPNNERELFDGNASVRAKLAFEVALHLSNEGTKESLDSTSAFDKMLTALHPYAQPVECDLNELQTQNENLERQNSFRPVFLNYFKTTLYHRVRAVKFRIILAEHSYDLQTLNAIWTEKKRDGLVEILQVIDELKSEEKTELADLFDSYFDPAKTTIRPIVKTNNNRRRNRRVRNNVRNNDGNATRSVGNEQGAGGDKQQGSNNASNLPDSTTKSPKNQRGKRNSRSYNNNNKNLLKTQTPVANDQTATANPTNNVAAAVTVSVSN
ncbi:maternal protein exuperantia [Lucilia cuprina]|uniref:maternal protein exuperantia n=1 Tax=Lucilia cuprina TaxID=7375 RepID=UPI001F05B12C|nr:maternal protein exuperantia [Lucilia cuprina]XP_023292504.2 maternal protein exuperantia [Lucilia cuprina]XP_046811258.1 maternal protein exuperantia [Lucilia cuprina]